MPKALSDHEVVVHFTETLRRTATVLVSAAEAVDAHTADSIARSRVRRLNPGVYITDSEARPLPPLGESTQ